MSGEVIGIDLVIDRKAGQASVREIVADQNFGRSAIETRFGDNLKRRRMKGTDLGEELKGDERTSKTAKMKFVKDVSMNILVIIDDVGMIRRDEGIRQWSNMTNREAMRKFSNKFRILI